MEETPKTKYTEAQKKATKKYRENNKEKVNEQRKKYYLNRKAKDPTFLEYKRNKAKEYYAKKKAMKKAVNEKVEERRLKSKDNEEIKKIEDEVKKDFENDKVEINLDILNKTELGQIIENAKKEDKELIITKIVEHPIIDETTQEKKKRKYVKRNKTI